VELARLKKGTRAGKNVEFNTVHIGKATYFSKDNSIVNANIGRFCSIGPSVKIGLGTNIFAGFVSTHPAFYLKREKLRVCYADSDKKNFDEIYPRTIIGNDVWIGDSALIKSGVAVGNGAIIGAGAIVVKDVAPYAIVGGVPAKLIRYRFSSTDIDFLEDFKWWEKSDAWLKEHRDEMLDIQAFIENNRKA
jgi:acetyltransferase-like isoleucine patch superfamily enzyme